MFSIKGQITNILGFRGQMFVATTQLCSYKALLMNVEVDILYNAHILLIPDLVGHWPYQNRQQNGFDLGVLIFGFLGLKPFRLTCKSIPAHSPTISSSLAFAPPNSPPTYHQSC